VGWQLGEPQPELPQIEDHHDRLGQQLPDALRDELDALAKRLTD
jgi:hypothetical protein